MSKNIHIIYVALFIFATVAVAIFLAIDGYTYYATSIEERFFNLRHTELKPSGTLGHGFGIIGTFMMIIGVSVYMIRKRYRRFFTLGYLSSWLEFHIFMCILGPILVLYHTAFKFGGIVAISFWSMVAVVVSGVIGRFIYVQIPRTIQGKELDINELDRINNDLSNRLRNKLSSDGTFLEKIDQVLSIEKYKNVTLTQSFVYLVKDYFKVISSLNIIKKELVHTGLTRSEVKEIIGLAKNRLLLTRRIGLLRTMQKVFRYWHIIHLPFAITMFIIMIVHVIITIVFGYKWIF